MFMALLRVNKTYSQYLVLYKFARLFSASENRASKSTLCCPVVAAEVHTCRVRGVFRRGFYRDRFTTFSQDNFVLLTPTLSNFFTT